MWGCYGIRQDGLGSVHCNQGIALSPLRSVQRNISATAFKNQLAAARNAEFARVPVAA